MIRFIKEKITYLENRLKDRLFTFRLLAGVLALDFIAFMSLSNVNPLQLLNPLKFFQANPVDTRLSSQIWFPRTITLQGLLDKNISQNPGVATAKDTFIPEEHSIKIEKKIVSRSSYVPAYALSTPELTLASLLLHEMITGPGEGMGALKASVIIKDREFFKYLWIQNDTLIIHGKLSTWQKLTNLEKKTIEYCITSTITQNIPQVKKIALYFSE